MPSGTDPTIWRDTGSPLIAATGPGPLAGLTVAVKDLLALEGFAVGAGNPEWLAGSKRETTTAAAPAALLAAGAAVAGIAQTDEFAYSLAGTNAHYGTPPNPVAPGRISGGSSSGSASAVALAQADIGLGTDTGGSIRVPAAYQGLYGIRTTHGAVSTAGVMPLAPSFDTVGWLTRDAETLARVGDVLLPDHPSITSGRLPRVLVAPELLDLAAPDVALAVQEFADQWTESDALALLYADVHAEELPAWLAAFQAVQAYEAWQQHGDWVSQHWASLGPDVAARFRAASLVSSSQADAARGVLSAARQHLRSVVRDAILVLPSASSVAPLLEHATLGGPVVEGVRRSTMLLTCIAGIAGLPAVNLPLFTAAGLPCGVSIVGPAHRDKDLLRLARHLNDAGLLQRKMIHA